MPGGLFCARKQKKSPDLLRIRPVPLDTEIVVRNACGWHVLQCVVSFKIAIQRLCHFLKNAFQESFIELHAPAFFVTRACSRHEAQIKHFRYVITFQFRKEEEKHIHYPCKMNAKIIPRVHVNSTQYN